MKMNALERRILGILRRHRWFAFRLLSMTGLMRRSRGAFRDVAITLINLEQGGYIRWPDKSSLNRISLLRKSYTIKAMFPRSLNHESNETILSPPYLSTQEERIRSKRRPNGPEQSSRRQRAVD